MIIFFSNFPPSNTFRSRNYPILSTFQIFKYACAKYNAQDSIHSPYTQRHLLNQFIMHPTPPLIGLGSALCPGFNYAFFGIFFSVAPHLAPLAVYLRAYEINMRYLCRRDPNAGSCQEIYCSQSGWTLIANNGPAGIAVEQCCHNDGRHNLEEGLINKREFQAIEATNALLDIHKRDYEEALEGGMSRGNLTALRNVQTQELKEAEKWQLMARLA
ncbi:hypothetical protein BDZ45DRAFT_696272 [Acephala macrosclerotiorum]|nr:hypothetical protein BDZ45DRAFT_696272 [Acephala macrosclerotiorum]